MFDSLFWYDWEKENIQSPLKIIERDHFQVRYNPDNASWGNFGYFSGSPPRKVLLEVFNAVDEFDFSHFRIENREFDELQFNQEYLEYNHFFKHVNIQYLTDIRQLPMHQESSNEFTIQQLSFGELMDRLDITPVSEVDETSELIIGMFKGNKLIGAISASSIPSLTNVMEMGIFAMIPDYRGKGLSSLLIDQFVKKLRNVGISYVKTGIPVSYEHFITKYNFREIGRVVSYTYNQNKSKRM